jgi:hypothetical protein
VEVIDPHVVSAVLVTRGNVDLSPVVESVRHAGIDDLVVWDNSSRLFDCSVAGRYAGIAEVRNPAVYVQDDDAIVDIPALLGAYHPGERLCSHDRREYTDSALIGWGALFPSRDPFAAFKRWFDHGGQRDRTFYRCADVIFTTLLPFRVVDVGHTDLPWATAVNRMYTGDPDHWQIRSEVLVRCREIRDKATE